MPRIIWRSHRLHGWEALRAASLILLFAATSSLQGTRAQESTPTTLDVRHEDGTLRLYRTFPGDLTGLLFPTGKALLDEVPPMGNWSVPEAFVLKKIQFVQVSDPQKRFIVHGVTYGDQLFLFDEFFCRQNPDVMSRLMLATSAYPRTPDQALSFAKLYLALTDPDFKDPDRSVISNASQVPAYTVGLPAPDINDVKDVLRPPIVRWEGSGFALDFFTTALDVAWVQRHRMIIGPQGFQKVSDQEIFPSHAGPRILDGQGSRNASSGRKEKVLFVSAGMGECELPDGVGCDFQLFSASDGPGLDRLHYYYKSPSHADAEWQEILTSAISVTERGPWLDEHGKIAGKKALVILVGKDKKTLWAASVFEDESSVLEIICACHGNLLASQ